MWQVYNLKKDMLLIIALLVFFDVYLLVYYNTFQYININKIFLIAILDVLALLPVLLFYLISFTILNSKKLFLIFNFLLWSFFPLGIFLLNTGGDLTSIQNGIVVFDEGKLTFLGYVARLENTFFLVFLWSFISYIKFKYKNKGE